LNELIVSKQLASYRERTKEKKNRREEREKIIFSRKNDTFDKN